MSTFAIFQTGGKQYRVTEGDIIKVEKLNATGSVEFDHVLMVGDKVGTPFINGAKIVADVIEQKRDDKVLVFKKKRRQNYRRTAGHRASGPGPSWRHFDGTLSCCSPRHRWHRCRLE